MFFFFGYHISFKLIDRGLIEILGPLGFVRLINFLSIYVSKLHTGFLNHYGLLIIQFLFIIFILVIILNFIIIDINLIFIILFCIIFFLVVSQYKQLKNN